MDIKVVGYNDLDIDNYKIINLEDIKNNKGDILIINIDLLESLYNELYEIDLNKYKKYDLYEYDRLNRYKYKNYKKVYFLNQDRFFYKYNYKNIYSNLYFIDDITEINYELMPSNKTLSNIKKTNINKLKEYINNKDTYFNSKDIMSTFKVSNRWIKRYMYEMNNIYNNIGYSYAKRMWYKTKKR